MQTTTILFIALTLGLSGFALFLQRSEYRRILLITASAVILYMQFNGIYLAGVSAANLGVQQGKANDSYIAGALRTMDSITPTRLIVSWGILFLTGAALFPSKLSKRLQAAT